VQARLLALILVAVAVGSCGGTETGPETAPAPEQAGAAPTAGLNVLLITVDTLRADALGAYGNRRAATPWMDRLAADGVRFENAHAHNVVTLPTHASILTGLHPQEHGVRDNAGFRLPEDLPTLATLLQERGYRTAAFISAFPLDSRFGLDRGFEVYEDSFVAAGRRPAFVELERPGDRTVALARKWIDGIAGDPWFCWVHLYEPHFPYEPPAALRSQFEDDPYLGDVAAADAALQPLLEPVLEGAEGGRTLVILTSDHGEALGEHGEATHGIFAYQSTLRVPLVLHQPQSLAARVIEEPVRHVDLLPTILDLVSVPIPDGLAGISLLPWALGERPEQPLPVYFEALSGQLNRGWAPLHGVRVGALKFIDLPVPELYDLSEDPEEAENLAGARPNRVRELRRVLDDLRATDAGAARTAEDAETLERLESLGYLSSAAEPKAEYTAADDPKNLIELDRIMRQIGGLYESGELEAALMRARGLNTQRPGMRMALLQLGQLERESGNLEAAVEAFRAACRLHPADNSTLAQLAAALTQAGRPAEAVALTESHSASAAADVDVLLVRALALAGVRDLEAARATLQKASRLDPANPMVSVHEGTLYLLSGERQAARSSFGKALALNGDTVAALTALGIMDIEEGRVDSGVSYWRRAVIVDPQQLQRLLAFASYQWNQGNPAARNLMELFLAEAPANLYREEITRLRQLLAGSG
jgi:tetratricopeptide (TPR) repeat protein